jgi:guanylate kinase
VQGAAKVKDKCPEAVLIFIIPPSLEELSRRLYRRNTDASDVIVRRLEKAREECRESVNYDYLVVNDNVMNAAQEILAILEAERCRVKKRLHLAESIIGAEPDETCH